MTLLKWLEKNNMIVSTSEGKRLAYTGAVKVNGETVKTYDIEVKTGDLIEVTSRLKTIVK